MGIADRFIKRAQGFKPGEFVYTLAGPRAGDRVMIVNQHPTFSAVAEEPVYVIQYEDGVTGTALLSEVAKTPPEPVQRELFKTAQHQHEYSVGDALEILRDEFGNEQSRLVGKKFTITEIDPEADGSYSYYGFIDHGDDPRFSESGGHEYLGFSEDDLKRIVYPYSPPPIRGEQDLVLE